MHRSGISGVVITDRNGHIDCVENHCRLTFGLRALGEKESVEDMNRPRQLVVDL